MWLGPIGYQHLIEHYGLPARPLIVSSRTESAVKGREVQNQGSREILVFEPAYFPEDTLSGHLQFALRYEGVNLEVLSLLFQQTGAEDLRSWLAEKPESKYARRAGFLYEWLTQRRLEVKVPAKSRYVAALDTDLQFGLEDGPRNEKFRVMDNLPGNPDFCPMVRRTRFLEKMIAADFSRKIQETLNRYDPDLLRRASAFLFLKETQSSFEVEREKPSTDRAQRFADLLRQADIRHPLSEPRLIELQNAVVDPRFHESAWRTRQNWLGRDLGYRRHMDFVPPRPEDVPSLMAGLLKLAGTSWSRNSKSSQGKGMDPVVHAAAVAFGLVFIHPFMDGNGRIHRFLIHEMLAKTGFTPPGMVLPVSAVILANLNEYVEALEAFSRP
ncbi:MAG: Fic family protein, partial [Fibrobacteria bacterium]